MEKTATKPKDDDLGSLIVTVVSLFSGLGMFLVGTVAGALIVRGLVLSVMWGWFVVPVFHVADLGIAQAIGLAMVGVLIAGRGQTNSEKKGWAEMAKVVLVWPALTLGVGYIVHLFV